MVSFRFYFYLFFVPFFSFLDRTFRDELYPAVTQPVDIS